MPIPVNIGVTSPLFGAEGRPIVEPGALLVTGNDNLRVNSWNALAGVTLTIRLRFIDAQTGDIVANDFTHTPNTNRTRATTDFPLSIGFPLNVTVFASSGTPSIGQCFVQVQIIRGFGGATTLLATLLQGYVTSVQALAYPGTPITASIDGNGAIRSITGTTPGAGVDVSETVPSGARWELLSFEATLLTSAVVGTRTPLLVMTDGVNELIAAQTLIGTPASTTTLYGWWPGSGSPTVAIASRANAQIPIGYQLLGGYKIKTVTQNIVGGDQWSAVQYAVREHLEAAA
jgi:hypothetical protein